MRTISLFPLLLLSSIVFAQNRKWDAVWMIGYGSQSGDTIYVNNQLDFNFNPVKVTGKTVGNFYFFDSNITMCDSMGNLQFYSNKCKITNWEGSTPMNGGEKLWNNKYDSSYCAAGGAIGIQGILSLPFPDSPSQYLIYYYEHGKVPIGGLRPLKLYSGLVDMSANGGKGILKEKYKIEIADTLGACYLTAVQHANGRDWWIVIPKYQSNRYYNLLLDPSGTHLKYLQYCGTEWKGQSDGSGQAVFSPSGTIYARISPAFGLHIFDFDRCSGKFSNPRQIRVDDNLGPQGVVISPNARYLYATTSKNLWQFDLFANDIESSRILIDSFDTSVQFNPVFYLGYLAPDNKIYISGVDTHKYLHVINDPDSSGLSCNFVQHGLSLPTFNYLSLPNNPYYRLGASGIVCDTTTDVVNNKPMPIEDLIRITPNPANEYVILRLPKETAAGFQLFSPTGHLVLQTDCREQFNRISINNLDSGIYFCQIRAEKGAVLTQKISIQR